MKKLSFKWRLTIPIAIALLVGVVLLIGINVVNSSVIARGLAEESLLNMADSKANLVKAELEINLGCVRGIAKEIESLIEHTPAENLQREEVMETMKKTLLSSPRMFTIFLYLNQNSFDGRDSEFSNEPYSDGTGVFAPLISKDDSGNTYISYNDYNEIPGSAQLFSSDKEMWSVPYSYDLEGTMQFVCAVNVPIKVNSRIIGFIGAEVNLENMSRNFSSEKIFKTGSIFLVANDTSIAVHTDSSFLSKQISEYTSARTADKIKNVMNSSSDGDIIEEYSSVYKKNVIYAFAPFTIGNAETHWSVGVVAPTGEVMAEINTGTLVSVASGLLLLLIVLAILYVSVSKSSSRIKKLSLEVSGYTERLNGIAIDVASSGEKISHGGMEQAASIEETSATMNETSSMVAQNNESTNQALNLTIEASEKVKKGSQSVAELIGFVNNLEVSSREISNIIETIHTIAKQTNILALNASVESARAGELGKAFSVVANEVRELAQRCNDAVKSTSSIINNNITLTKVGIEHSHNVQESFEMILVDTEKIKNLIREINTASEEQSRGVSQINSALSQMETVTQDNAASAQQNASSANEMKELTEHLADATKEFMTIINGG